MIETLVLTFALAAPAIQGPRSEPDPTAIAPAHRAERPPRVDGRDDDEIWQSIPATSSFRQFDPRIDSDPSFDTHFRVAYDDDHLYVMVRAFDSHPDSIMHALTRRDVRGASDQITLYVDSYDDGRTGFKFSVNPDGVKRDFAIFNDGEEDGSWNAVWDVAARVDSLGWTAEFSIPLSQLRFVSGAAHTFGFGVWREVMKQARWMILN
jgi:hypothetical protein